MCLFEQDTSKSKLKWEKKVPGSVYSTEEVPLFSFSCLSSGTMKALLWNMKQLMEMAKKMKETF